ncbi:cytochrome c maturation protein CcmE [Actibacterium sp. MT2.3-13A]|uniref:cytochrome c maturation protein CcmE n=1 Tax=Actibacterium sp. MT2.3-13A TaxID=2828332 RepID=UPI001BA4F796|nr:cytochrome c maturation protein CcmE [Actibacterium sp. MT2.3-13A]
MRGLKKQRRIQIIVVAFVALAVSTALIGYGLRDGINFFRSPSEVVAEPPAANEEFRLGGLVKEGSMTPVQGVQFSFVITDGGADIPVDYVGNDPKPDLFSEGQGTIATGRYVDGVFKASVILAKHDEEYMPKEVIDALKEQGVYEAPDKPAANGS